MLRIVVIVLLTLFSAVAHAEDDRARGARAIFDRYFNAADAADGDASYALLSPELQALKTLQTHERYLREALAQRGPLATRSIMRTTVYENPPNAPAPGIYVAFDFVGRFERADYYCGYLIAFRSEGANTFVVMRTEETVMDRITAEALEADPAPPTAAEAWASVASSSCRVWLPEPAPLSPLLAPPV